MKLNGVLTAGGAGVTAAAEVDGQLVETTGAFGAGVPGTTITGGQDGQAVLTVNADETPVTPVAIVELGQTGHLDVTTKVELEAGSPGAIGGQLGQRLVTVIVRGG